MAEYVKRDDALCALEQINLLLTMVLCGTMKLIITQESV